ncbi:MAG: hypothetical protein M0P57_07675 [Syntrophales bacterium]|jgi:hypothetical protein|nr:hypothetical protein [Syntrophales bacterium]
MEMSTNYPALPLESDILFSNHKNVYKKGIEKRQKKFIQQISFLKPFLKEDEKIFLITTGCSPMSFLEQFLMGWIVYYLKRSLFIFTNRRIFHIPSTFNYKYRNSIAQILYSDCRNIEIKGRSLNIKYKKGKKEKFFYIARKEKKKVKTLLSAIAFDGSPGKSGGRVHLCPRCAEELVQDEYTCPGCRLEFKNKAAARKISLLYPGGGYFYTGHWWLGICDAFSEAILLVLVIVSLVEVIQGVEGGIESLVTFAIILTLEKALTVYHSNHFIKEYMPAAKEIVPILATK